MLGILGSFFFLFKGLFLPQVLGFIRLDPRRLVVRAPTSTSIGACASSSFGCAIGGMGSGCDRRKASDARPAATASNAAPPTAATTFPWVVWNQAGFVRSKVDAAARAAAVPPRVWPLGFGRGPDLAGFAAAEAGVLTPVEVDGSVRDDSQSSAATAGGVAWAGAAAAAATFRGFTARDARPPAAPSDPLGEGARAALTSCIDW